MIDFWQGSEYASGTTGQTTLTAITDAKSIKS